MLRKEGSEEFLYLSDYAHGIVTKRTLKGEEVFTLGYPVESSAYDKSRNQGPVNYQPTNVAIAPNRDFYVGDGYGSSYINQYNKDAQFIRTFGGLGKGPGQLDCPHGLWVDTRGDVAVLVVADRSNQRLQRFTLDGKHIDFILGTSRLPCHFHERNGEVVIPDLWSKVVVLDRYNKLVATLGDGQYSQDDWNKVRTQERETFVPGKFICPHSACFDHAGNIFVVEWVEVRQGYETSQSCVENETARSPACSSGVALGAHSTHNANQLRTGACLSTHWNPQLILRFVQHKGAAAWVIVPRPAVRQE